MKKSSLPVTARTTLSALLLVTSVFILLLTVFTNHSRSANPTSGTLAPTLGAGDVLAATFTVTNTNDSGAGSLRQAVLDSNTMAGSDMIVFDSSFNTPQTITLATVITINPATGDSLTITGPGAHLLTVSGNNAVRIFFVSSGDTASISGMTLTQGTPPGSGGAIDNNGTLTVTNANFNSNTASGSGGAIDNDGGTLTVTNSAFNSNTGAGGGAINNGGLSLTVVGCTFTNNTANSGSATGNGGGAILNISSEAIVTISDSTFTGNTQTAGSGPSGGALRNRFGTMNITNSTFSNNTALNAGGAISNNGIMSITGSTVTDNSTTGVAKRGGGISNPGGQLTITNTAVTGNSATGDGGGIFYSSAGEALNISNSTISGNTANAGRNPNGYGGGIHVDGNLTISRSTISGNTVLLTLTPTEDSQANGGGIWSEGQGQVIMDSCTVSGNTAAVWAGGVSILRNSADSTITNSTIVNNTAGSYIGGLSSDRCGAGASCKTLFLGNTIIANNTAPAFPDARFGPIDEPDPAVSLGYNLIENMVAYGFTPTSTDITGVDPTIDPLQDNGGPTLTHALLTGSPAIDQGNSFGLETDQRGVMRPFDHPSIANADGGDGADIGAFELSPPVPLVSVLSRKVHDATAFDINLPLTGDPGVECRTGGASGDYRLIFSFANTLTSVGGASVTSGTGSVSSHMIGANAQNYIVNLTGVTNAQVIRVRLSNVNDSAGNHSNSVLIFVGVLLGDTTGNGSVNSSDIGQTKSRSGQPATAANFRSDVTVSGSINSSDIGLVKSKSGTNLP